MKDMILTVFILIFLASPTVAADGMRNVESAFSVEVTANRMENILKEKGMKIFNRIKHSEGASHVGIELRETQLLLFGNAKVGGPLMKCQQSVAIDLPQKALVWIDGNNQVWISYNDPRYLEKRHHVTGCEKVISKIEKALASITKAASRK